MPELELTPHHVTWQPALGARCRADGVHFSVWAPEIPKVEVVIRRENGGEFATPMSRDERGVWHAVIPHAAAGDHYGYLLDGYGPFPDPASRFQPDGVHGLSQIVDPSTFGWTDQSWRGIGGSRLVVYELHIGTFTPQGTFAAAAAKLPDLEALGVNVIELMPVAAFPGRRNWGYDGVALFAPTANYGTPDDLRRFVDEAHRLHLGVCLDVVYNHVGPDGNYLPTYSPHYFTARHHTPWGSAVNFDGPHSERVREFVIENALHWLHEYHLDALRLDAVHAIVDTSPRHILAELCDRVDESNAPATPVVLIAEDALNRAHIVEPRARDGWGFDGVWADDFHHEMRRYLAGDHESYFQDFHGSLADVATIVQNGWLYRGQASRHFGGPRGTDPSGIPLRQFLIGLQTHDQVGNRALGDRLHHRIELAAYRAASAILLCAPETPLLFMGQEWAASTPFLYFTDHHEELGRLVTEGRRKEFSSFASFSDPEAREQIPDPQRETTFTASQLMWAEREQAPHGGVLRLYKALLALRRTEPALEDDVRASVQAAAAGPDGFIMLRRTAGAPAIVVAARVKGAGILELRHLADAWFPRAVQWQVVLTTEDGPFVADPAPLAIEHDGAPVIRFNRPSAAIFKVTEVE